MTEEEIAQLRRKVEYGKQFIEKENALCECVEVKEAKPGTLIECTWVNSRLRHKCGKYIKLELRESYE
jgi:hypothetical protein